jgi:hypothetical protein
MAGGGAERKDDMGVERLYIVEASCSATQEKLVWAESSAEARAETEFDGDDLEWRVHSVREADEHDARYHPRQVWDGEQWRDPKELLALCTPESLEEREESARQRAEWDAHPKLLEV